jgi:RNA polymerase sigma factor (sigma-70 family)
MSLELGGARERDLIALARAGDGDAYARLVAPYHDVAFRMAWLVTGSAADAEDALQLAHVRAWRSLGRFREGAEFRPWFLTIVANQARTGRLSAARRLARTSRLAAGATRDAADVEASPEAVLLRHEQDRELAAALAHVPDDDRKVLLCRFALDLGVQETATVLGCRPGTVKSRTSRALTRLRTEMEGGDGEH